MVVGTFFFDEAEEGGGADGEGRWGRHCCGVKGAGGEEGMVGEGGGGLFGVSEVRW